MKHFFLAGILTAAAAAAAQDQSRLYSAPSLPSREALERLNLRLAWSANVPMDGRRDGFTSIQLNGNQVFAQTRGGTLAAYDADTGRPQWKTLAGKPFDVSYPPAFNGRSVFVITGSTLIAYDRFTGALQWQYRLRNGIACAPVVDESLIYACGTGSRLAAFLLPALGADGAPATTENASKVRDTSNILDPAASASPRPNLANEVYHDARPEPVWDSLTNLHLDYAPLATRDLLFVVTPAGDVRCFGKRPLYNQTTEVYRYALGREVPVPPGQYEETAYVAGRDANLNAINIPNGKFRWRFTAGTAITRRPLTTETDVYVVTDRKGLFRLDREEGHAVWKIPSGWDVIHSVPEADRVLAVNPKFVYAADRAGRLLVLDRATGRRLSHYDLSDYTVPVANESTDRLILAANNGLIICLHDREYEKPYRHRKPEAGDRPGAKSVLEILARKVSAKKAEPTSLRDALDTFRRTYGLNIIVSERAFADAGLPPVLEKIVQQNGGDNLPVGDLLKQLTDQVGGTYETVGQVVMVLPPKKAGPGPGPEPMPLIDDSLREALAKKVNAPAVDKATLGEALLGYSDRFGIKLNVDEEAFKAAGVDRVMQKEINYPKGDGVALSEVLKKLLAQVNGTYEAKGDTVTVVPLKR